MPIHIAAEKNSIEMFNLLIEKGVDVNSKSINQLNLKMLLLINIINN